MEGQDYVRVHASHAKAGPGASPKDQAKERGRSRARSSDTVNDPEALRLDLCAGAGDVAKACLLAKKSYVGMCLCC